MKYKILAIGAVLLLCVAAALAADVTGKWVAETQGRNGPQQITFNLKQEGTKVTGSITTTRGENPISDGKIEGDDVSFVQTMSFGGNEMKMVWKGKVSGDEIKFTRTMEGGPGGGMGGGRGPGAQEIVAKRAK
jgi:hypothetical protein